jgi:hypothetical protein
MRLRTDLNRSIVRIIGRDITSAGTGFFADKDGLLLTCEHLLKHAEFDAKGRVKIASPKLGREFSATVVCADPTTDIAVLKLAERLPDEIIPLELGDGLVRSGSVVSSFGFPLQYAANGIPGEGNIIEEADFEGQRVFVFQSQQFTLGFSGAPGIEEDSGLVVGMICVISKPDLAGQLRGTGLLIRSMTLKAVCPSLTLKTDSLTDSYALAVARYLSRPSYFYAKAHENVKVPYGYVPIKLKLASEDMEIASAVGAASTASRVLLLTGLAGTGKSSTVRYIATKCWSAPAEVGLKERRLPLYIHADSLARSPGKEIAQRLHNAIFTDPFFLITDAPTEERFVSWIDDPNLNKLLVIDGFDEWTYEDRTIISEYIQILAANQSFMIFVSSRPIPMLEGLGDGYVRAETSIFSQTRVREMASLRLGTYAQNFLDWIKDSSSREELSTSPFLTTLMINTYQSDQLNSVNSRVELYENAIAETVRPRKRAAEPELREWQPYILEMLAEVACASIEQENPIVLKAAEAAVKKFLIQSLGTTPAKATQSKGVLEFLVTESGILYSRDGRIYWAHKTFAEFLAARAFSTRIEMGQDSFRNVAGKWKYIGLRGTAIFFLEMNIEREDFYTVIEDILTEDGGDLFMFEALLNGLELRQKERSELAQYLRFASKEEYVEDPTTLCSTLLAGGGSYISAFLQLYRKDACFRDEMIKMLSDELVPIDFRSDVFHSIRSYVTPVDLQTIEGNVSKAYWEKMNAYR